MVKYNILSTGSKGNAVIIHDFVLIDCGVPYRMIQPYICAAFSTVTAATGTTAVLNVPGGA